MPLGILIMAISVVLAVHVVKTGRPYFWIWLVLFLPVLGGIVYFVAEILPEIGQSRPVRNAAGRVGGALRAERQFRDLAASVAEAPTVANRQALAEALARRGDNEGALTLFEQALTGPHQTDPALLLGLARCQFAKGDFTSVLDSLDRLQAGNPGYQSHDGHLLYARALEGCGRADEALQEYAALAPVYPGQEARVRYALLLDSLGRRAEAQGLFSFAAHAIEQGSRHSRRLDREWYDIARRHAGG